MTFTYGDSPGKSGTSTATATTDASLTRAVPVRVWMVHVGVTVASSTMAALMNAAAVMAPSLIAADLARGPAVAPTEAVPPVAAAKPVEIINLTSSSENF